LNHNRSGLTFIDILAGDSIPFIPRVTLTGEASKGIDTGGFFSAIICSRKAFVHVLAGKSIPRKSGIAFTGIGPLFILACCVLITGIRSQITFVDIFTGQSIPLEPLLAFAEETSLGICTRGLIVTWL